MYRVECQQIASYEDFIEAFNKGLVERVGGKWNGNLNAFRDYLSWPEVVPYELEICGSSQCEQVLGRIQYGPRGESLWAVLKEILLGDAEWVSVKFS
jgi:hypothetical protein